MKTNQSSIWKRDLWETKVGRFLRDIALPILALAWGLSAIITGKVRIRGVEIVGLEAVLFGIGTISFFAGTYSLSWYGGDRYRSYLKGIAILCFAVAIVALFTFIYRQF